MTSKHEPWDPDATGDMPEAEWRRTVVGRFNEVCADIVENTDVTRKLGDEVRPMVDAYAKVAKGFEVLGWIGSAVEWVVRKWYIAVAIALAIKIIFFGGSWADVVKLFKDVPP